MRGVIDFVSCVVGGRGLVRSVVVRVVGVVRLFVCVVLLLHRLGVVVLLMCLVLLLVMLVLFVLL